MESEEHWSSWRVFFVALVFGAWVVLVSYSFILKARRRDIHRLEACIQALEERVTHLHDQPSEAGINGYTRPLKALPEEKQGRKGQ